MIWLLCLACTSRPDPQNPPDAGTADTSEPADTGSSSSTTPVDTGPNTPIDEPLALCINEWMPRNENSIRDDLGLAPDWLELHNPTADPIPLSGYTLTSSTSDPHPLGNLVVPPEGFLLLWADGNPDAGPTHVDLKLPAEGGSLALHAPDGRGTVVRWGHVEQDFAIARTTDCCEGEGCFDFVWRGTPGATNEPPFAPTDDVLVPFGATWRYFDQGAPDPSWASPAFDDSVWSQGPAPLGYGDAHIVTPIDAGPDPYNKPVTAYFRTQVDLTAPLTGIHLDLIRDDAAAVYVNGVEVLRENLPKGALLHDTLALATAYSETLPTRWSLASAPWVEGNNVVAIEVHQVSPDSSDLGLDASLIRVGP